MKLKLFLFFILFGLILSFFLASTQIIRPHKINVTHKNEATIPKKIEDDLLQDYIEPIKFKKTNKLKKSTHKEPSECYIM